MAGVKWWCGEGKLIRSLYEILMRELNRRIISFLCKNFLHGSAQYLH